MSETEQPSLSPSLIQKIREADIHDLADMLERLDPARNQPDPLGDYTWIKAGEIDRIEETYKPKPPEPVWPLEPVAKMEDEIYVLYIPSVLTKDGQMYVFFATADFKNLAVPISLLSFEHLPDPVLKRWHWWRGPGAETLGTNEAARALAKAIVRRHDGITDENATNRTLDRKFEIDTGKSKHTFMTREGWRGLWAPTYMRPEQDPEIRAAMFVRIFSESKIEGMREVKKYARTMARKYDKVKNKPRPPITARGPYKGMYIPILHQRKWDHLQRWMAFDNPNGCSRSQVIKNLIDDQFNLVPPESEWPVLPYRRSSMEDTTALTKNPAMVWKTDETLGKRKRQVLEAASRLARPGGVVSPNSVAKMLGITRNNASLVIGALRKANLWPYVSPQPGRKRKKSQGAPRISTPRDEQRAAADIIARLLRIHDPDARRRVLEMVEEAQPPEEPKEEQED